MEIRRTLIIFFLLIVACLFSSAVNAGEKLTLRGKIKSIDLSNGTFVVTSAKGEDMTFTMNESVLDKFKKGMVEAGDLITVWYIESGGENQAVNIMLHLGCEAPLGDIEAPGGSAGGGAL